MKSIEKGLKQGEMGSKWVKTADKYLAGIFDKYLGVISNGRRPLKLFAWQGDNIQHTEIAKTRLNQPRGQFRENYLAIIHFVKKRNFYKNVHFCLIYEDISCEILKSVISHPQKSD